MRILIIGGNGMLGHKLIQILSDEFEIAATVRLKKTQLKRFNFESYAKIYDEIYTEKISELDNVILEFKPDVVINAVGIIKQLPESKNDTLLLDTNSIFPKILSLLAKKFEYKLINISTDCVFSGIKGNYNEMDIPDAADMYGKSKYLGEVISENCLTIRTSIIGRELFTSHSLIEWFLSNQGKIIKGYTNAIYSGFPTIVLANIISDLLLKFPNLNGLFHISSNPINKFELLKLVKNEFDLNIEIEPFEDFKIDRSLDSTKFRTITGFEPASWTNMIAQLANDPTPYDKWRKHTV